MEEVTYKLDTDHSQEDELCLILCWMKLVLGSHVRNEAEKRWELVQLEEATDHNLELKRSVKIEVLEEATRARTSTSNSRGREFILAES